LRSRPTAPEIVEQAPASLPAEYAWLRDEQLRNKAKLLADMKEIFHDQLQWVAETSDRVELGLSKRSLEQPLVRPLAVRVIVERKAAHDAPWQIVWAADVIAKDQELVQFQPSAGSGDALSLWAYRLPDGAVYVESDVRLSGKYNVRCAATTLHADRSPAQVATVKADGAEYRVLHSAASLNDVTS
jgi:hypothetical protein